MTKQWNAYHFVGEMLRDGRPVPKDGETLTHVGKIKMCKTGFHASRKAWQALNFAPGCTLCRVHCEEIEHEDSEKLVCRKRTIISRIDAEKLLWDFARLCALDVAHLWDAPDVVVEYLNTGDESLRAAARDAAWAAARATARDAAWAAEWDATRDAAWAAARDAAWDAWAAARATARAAARATARAAAWDAARDAWAAARDAAWDAAWDAANKKQRTRFTRMVNQEFAKKGGKDND